MMKQDKTKTPEAGMRAEYDFRGGVRGKYAARYAEGTSVTVRRRPKKSRVKPRSAR